MTLLRDAQIIHALVKLTSIRRERWKMIKSATLAAVAVVAIGAAAEAAAYRGTLSLTEAYIDYNVMDEELREREYLTGYWGLDLGKSYTAKFQFSRPLPGVQQTLKLSIGSLVLFNDVIQTEGAGYSGFTSIEGITTTNISSRDGLLGGLAYTIDSTDLIAIDANYSMQPAPIPVPASAALLPLGLGALAMMRKRRRKTS